MNDGICASVHLVAMLVSSCFAKEHEKHQHMVLAFLSKHLVKAQLVEFGFHMHVLHFKTLWARDGAKVGSMKVGVILTETKGFTGMHAMHPAKASDWSLWRPAKLRPLTWHLLSTVLLIEYARNGATAAHLAP
ncbi:hypothetical protein DUNSADRAFT_1753 [Dunaliella salina]|uniref:Secreted protein n=1 Tax=Dunaliella salina TaxID=3046 RepID=A0ABQ7FX39_DUNSA|nr:hypothetical protein DUNSADRAFT_1753 [Dunaliella salina]|eukprot:KAF5826922.1 hypothetical protein DUNSADRAFT_1753 [Dunaliella salina]